MKNKEFQDSIIRLKEISKEIDSDGINFPDSIDLFEEGMELTKKCKNYIDKSELRIQKIISKNGGLELHDFDMDLKK